MNKLTIILICVSIAVLGYGLWMIYSPVSLLNEPGAHELAEARLAAVRTASTVTLPDTTLLAVSFPPTVHGEQSSSSRLVTYAMIFRARHDFRTVPMDDARGGPVRALLALSERQARALADAGFEPVNGSWSTSGREVLQPVSDYDSMWPQPFPVEPPDGKRRPEIKVRHEKSSATGSGAGGYLVDLNDPRITTYRIYFVPLSGATVFVNNTYDRTIGVVDSEFAFCDRTLFGVEYPKGSYIQGRQPGHFKFREWIKQPDR